MPENLYLKIFKILTKKIFVIAFLFAIIMLVFFVQNNSYPAVIKAQVHFAPNNISTWIQNTGTFNQDIRTTNTPGFQWPSSSGKFALFTSGLSIGAFVNGELRLGNASYNGEYAPGYVLDSAGTPLFKTNTNFKLYSVRYNDTRYNNPDVLNWKYMIRYGAPYVDINGNKIYDDGIDKPGIPDASQTIFLCYTDADASNHSSSEGFSGGTLPLFAEVHLTAWGYDHQAVEDVQFFKFDVINKSNFSWEKTYFSFVTDPDLGNATDDYIGCDTNLQMNYCYNAINQDQVYGQNPPAVGQVLLRGAINKNNLIVDSLNMTSSLKLFKNFPWCETLPNAYPISAYRYFRGTKNEGTPYLNPTLLPHPVTKFCLTGNPEDSTGWIEKKGWIHNCGGELTGPIELNPPGDRRYIFSTGSDLLNVNPLDTQKIVMAQMIARGSSNVNSVTKLKTLAEFTRRIYFEAIEGRETYYTEPPVPLPDSYRLFQNFPNPFNPVTTIKYEMKKLWNVKIQVYDTKGELISTLVNEEKPQGSYEIKFDASGLPSGIYFVKMVSGGGFEDSKKMVVIK